MKFFFFLTCILLFLTSCKESTLQPKNTSAEKGLALDKTLLSVDTTTTVPLKHDSKWLAKDLFDADDENYLLQSVEIFRKRFDSIMKHNEWDLRLGKGVYESKNTYDIFTIPLDKNIKIITRLDKKYHRITKVFLLAEGYGEDRYYSVLIKVMKGLILTTLNSNFDTEDAELIIHQISLLNEGFSGPGVLQLDGHRYEAHKYENLMYFGIRT
ncbi:hypothetical protein [Flavobacterium sp. NRK1]|uniref:hypothetical protein n=1 Tax=Flavobacterium sp. NRK1 TaxID=2954929 RepID=UPI00209345E8|nr:hypothetical protein [Flavobacterium sp. NRK1]MCO6147333.1 hypothetical protein [Flavobacterium sp. NRK1]